MSPILTAGSRRREEAGDVGNLRWTVFAAALALAAGLAGCTTPPSASAPVSAGKATSAAGATSSNTTNTSSSTATNPGPLRFVVTFPASARSNAVTGRVLLFLARKGGAEPRHQTGMLSLDPQPVYGLDVTNWIPGTPVEFRPEAFRGPDALAFPGPMDRIEPGSWRAQALVDLDTTARDINAGPGNLYSRPVACELRGANGGRVELVADQVMTSRPPKDTDWVKLVEVRSRLLSEFHGRETKLRAAVILPAGFTNAPADRRYPAVYVVPGFGGRHTSAWGWMDSSAGRRWKEGRDGVPHLRVVLDPDVPLGHSVFANSANNGPVGDALVQELIPEIERRFRGLPESWARLVTGHSSGGWSSLWLQVAYPDFFGGCWSTAPDPVDFRAFQTMNLYEDRNGHWTREGQLRPVARGRDRVLLNIQQLNLLEHVVGYGGQLDSFDAVFSPRGTNGRPRRVMDKLSGAIDREVVVYWQRYDIRRVLEENWPVLGPKLQGKLHVIAAGWDTFYLEPAVEYLRDFLATKDHGGYVEIHPGDHGSVITPALRDRMEREMTRQFEQRGRGTR